MTPTAVPAVQLDQPHWSSTEARNARIISDFVRRIMNEHDFDSVREQYRDSAYRQHSRGIPDGIPGLLENLTDLTKRFPEFSYDVKRVMVDGDLVTFHSHATMRAKHRGDDRKGFDIIDIWRVSEDGDIVEHWDAIQPLDFSMRLYALVTGGRIRNTNGVF